MKKTSTGTETRSSSSESTHSSSSSSQSQEKTPLQLSVSTPLTLGPDDDEPSQSETQPAFSFSEWAVSSSLSVFLYISRVSLCHTWSACKQECQSRNHEPFTSNRCMEQGSAVWGCLRKNPDPFMIHWFPDWTRFNLTLLIQVARHLHVLYVSHTHVSWVSLREAWHHVLTGANAVPVAVLSHPLRPNKKEEKERDIFFI